MLRRSHDFSNHVLSPAEGAAAALGQHIADGLGQRSGLTQLLVHPQHGRPFVEIRRAGPLGRRAQAGLDRLDAIRQSAQPNAVCPADGDQQGPPFSRWMS